MNFEFSKHALDVIDERKIDKSWVIQTIESPDDYILISTNEVHYIKQIKEFGKRFLRVVLNPETEPSKIITVFFDRRIKK